MSFEDDYMDVLQNIEFAIVTFYRSHRDLSDYDAMRALEALINQYVAEERKPSPRAVSLSEQETALLEAIKDMCEWRLGRAPLDSRPGMEEATTLPPKTVGEMIRCLKRLLKSARMWNKEAGRQGHLDFVSQFIV